ncbi:MAG: phosphoribosylformylglycinamidine synthase I [Thermoplasmata archaeon]|nr:phosphoribosylformylglycinamidine synthase I [Thermoplasmata archaeon]
MRTSVRVGILSIEGTNCDRELGVALAGAGAQPEVVHLKQFEGRDVRPEDRRRLSDFRALLVPGGFSGGDYVRAGAILAARMRAAVGPELEAYLRGGGYLGGICNGFQVLTELGLLPGRPGQRLGPPEAALMPNQSGHFECRPTFLRWEGGNFAPLRGVQAGRRLYAPSAHGEGHLCLAGDEERRLDELEAAGQILFRWVDPEGRAAGYPWNPNGSPRGVAGLTNPEGNVFGLMPHPERGFFRRLEPDWTRAGEPSGPGGGRWFFDELVHHLAQGPSLAT